MSEKMLMYGMVGSVWVPIQTSLTGAMSVALYSPSNGLTPDIDTLASDGVSPTGMATYAQGLLFNGASWDRERANTTETVLASAARAACI